MVSYFFESFVRLTILLDLSSRHNGVCNSSYCLNFELFASRSDSISDYLSRIKRTPSATLFRRTFATGTPTNRRDPALVCIDAFRRPYLFIPIIRPPSTLLSPDTFYTVVYVPFPSYWLTFRSIDSSLSFSTLTFDFLPIDTMTGDNQFANSMKILWKFYQSSTAYEDSSMQSCWFFSFEQFFLLKCSRDANGEAFSVSIIFYLRTLFLYL